MTTATLTFNGKADLPEEANAPSSPAHTLRRQTNGASPDQDIASLENNRDVSLLYSTTPHDRLIHKVSVELIEDIAAMRAHREDWSRLSANALEQNVLLDPPLALAAATHIDTGKKVSLALVWAETGTQDGPHRKLIGLFPMTAFPFRWGLPIGCAKGWEHLYCFLTTPLLDRSEARLAAEGFFRWLKQNRSLPRFLIYQILGRDKVWSVLNDVFAQNEIRVDEYNPRERAMLKTDLNGEDYLRQSLGRKRRKEYRRLFNRLSDLGPVEIRHSTKPADISDAAERFLELEFRGWKGKRSSALQSSESGRLFFLDALGEMAALGNCKFTELMLGDKLISSVLVVTSGRVGWMWKIAYDEDYSRYSPGVLLVLDLTKSLADDKTLDFIDSGALPDHPMINNIWRERFALTDILITLRPGIIPSSIIVKLESLRRAARAKLKTLFNTYVRR